MITDIQACGHMVKVTSDFRGVELISRREAILRLEGILGMDKSSKVADMLEKLVYACNDARINELGVGYSKHVIDALLNKIRDGQKEAYLRDKSIAHSDIVPAGVTRKAYSDDKADKSNGLVITDGTRSMGADIDGDAISTKEESKDNLA